MQDLPTMWWEQLKGEELKPYWKKLDSTIDLEYIDHKCYPERGKVFEAFKLTPFDEVKVVLIGQDPYVNGHAHGLAFSSLQEKTPFSLKYIFNEIARDVLRIEGREDVSMAFPTNNLSCWAKQGVLLLNPVLTVREGQSNSHAGLGWEEFTSKAIQKLWETDRKIIFVAWGAKARIFLKDAIDKSSKTIASDKNTILMAGHPAAAAYGKDVFSGCGHFSKINEYHYINWRTYVTNN